jgi:murein DD-endopeptidase MepM/ murein hydrolase activator NlpD
MPVLAPGDGRVVRVINDVPDQEGLKSYPRRSLLDSLQRPEWIFGNFVVLDIGEGVFALLAHLKEGSISVEPGQTVRAGDRIAACGNSGNTFEPHIHLQVMDRPDPAHPDVRGLPAVFVDYLQFEVVEEGDLLAKRMPSGDPPEWSVVAPATAAKR